MEQSNMGGAAAAPAARPTLVTVLCILSWIGSGLGIIAFGLLLVGAGFLANSSFGALLGPALAGGSAMVGGLLVANIGCFVGALMMWKMKKTGFFIYAGCQLLGIVLPIAFGGGFSVMGLIFPALFIALYGMNLKHMK